MGFFDCMKISGSALTAQRLRMEVIATNLANAETTGPGGPYRRKLPVFAEQVRNLPGVSRGFKGEGVKVVAVVEDPSPFRKVYDPSNPFADAQGFVEKPNVNPVTEMIDLMAATRAYEANVSVLNDAKRLVEAALQLAT